jgi:hypothetical protein
VFLFLLIYGNGVKMMIFDLETRLHTKLLNQ